MKEILTQFIFVVGELCLLVLIAESIYNIGKFIYNCYLYKYDINCLKYDVSANRDSIKAEREAINLLKKEVKSLTNGLFIINESNNFTMSKLNDVNKLIREIDTLKCNKKSMNDDLYIAVELLDLLDGKLDSNDEVHVRVNGHIFIIKKNELKTAKEIMEYYEH